MMNDYFDDLKKGALISAGDISNFNTMTIGWGAHGILYREEVFFCFVKENRYTYEFMEKNKYFVISFFDKGYEKALGYLGTVSGRDEEKVKNTVLTPIDIDGIGVGFKEAKENILCELIYSDEVNIDVLDENIVNKYYKTEPPHKMYVGKIIKRL